MPEKTTGGTCVLGVHNSWQKYFHNSRLHVSWYEIILNDYKHIKNITNKTYCYLDAIKVW